MKKQKVRLEYPNQSPSAKAEGKKLAEKIKKEISLAGSGNVGVVGTGANGNILPYV